MPKLKINANKIAIFTDYHLGVNANNLSKLDIALQYSKWFINECKKEKVTKVIFLGDWFHDRTSLNINTLNVSYEILKSIAEEFKVFLILGNHDIFYKQNMSVHSLKAFSDIDNLNLISSTTELIINDKYETLLCPFHWEVPSKKYDILFGHFEMSGAKMASGLSSDKMEMSKLTQFSKLSFSGHYHISKEYKFKNGKVITVGSTHEHDWGDYGNKKYIYILDGNTLEYKKIENTITPKHKKLFWSNLDINLKQFKGHYIKIIIDTEYEYDKVNEMILKLKTLGALSVNLDFIFSVNDQLLAGQNKSNKKAYTKFEYIKNYIDDMGDIPNIDKKDILNKMTEYFEIAEKKSEKTLSLNANDIIFKSISIQNFKSIGQKIIMNYNEYEGVWFVKGKNIDKGGSVGAGKTSIISAIIFALYGKDLKNTKNKFIFNRLLGDSINTEVLLEFTINKKLYKVITWFNPRTRGLHMELFEDQNGEWLDITKSTIFETKKYIEFTLLKCSYDLFKSSIYLCGQDYKSFFTLSKSAKRSFLENVFNLTIFGEILSLVRSDYNKLNNEINLLENKIGHNTKLINNLNKQKITFDKDKAIEIENIKTNIKDKVKKIKELSKTTYDKDLEELSKNLKLNTDIAKDIKNYTAAKRKLEKLILTNENSNKYIEKDITKYDKILNSICDKCEQKIKTNFKINSNTILLNENKTKLDNAKLKLQKLNNKLESLNKCYKEEMELKLNIKELKLDKKYNDNAIQTLKTDILDLRTKLNTIKNKENTLDVIIKDTEKELNIDNTNIKKYYKNLTVFDILSTISSEDGVKTYIIQDLIQVLNKLMHKYLNRMNAEFSIIFNNNFDVEFLTISGACSFDNFSGGEKRMIETSAMFAFRRLLWADGIRSNITVLDEVLDSGISDSHIKLFLDIIKYESIKDFKKTNIKTSTFIITHKNIDEEEFDGVLTIQKENGISTIV